MRILFISSNLIGDSIISTGILSYLCQNNKDSKITIVTGPTAKELFENYPNVEKIIVVKKMKYNLHWINLWIQLIKKKWNLVIDLRSSFMGYFILSKERKIFRNTNESITQVEKLSNFLNLNQILSPKIYCNNQDRKIANSLIKNKIVFAIAPGGNWPPKIWPAENYNKLIISLQKLYPQKRIHFLITGSTNEKDKYFEKVIKNIAEDSIINIMGNSLNITYACYELCKAFIGNDSGLMHLSAAAGINTIGLFGPTRDDWYRPYGEKCYVLRTKESFIELRKELKDSSKSLMSSITVDQVIELIMKKNII